MVFLTDGLNFYTVDFKTFDFQLFVGDIPLCFLEHEVGLGQPQPISGILEPGRFYQFLGSQQKMNGWQNRRQSHAGGICWEGFAEFALQGLDWLRLEISPESVIDYGSLGFGGLQGEAYKFKTEGEGVCLTDNSSTV